MEYPILETTHLVQISFSTKHPSSSSSSSSSSLAATKSPSKAGLRWKRIPQDLCCHVALWAKPYVLWWSPSNSGIKILQVWTTTKIPKHSVQAWLSVSRLLNHLEVQTVKIKVYTVYMKWVVRDYQKACIWCTHTRSMISEAYLHL